VDGIHDLGGRHGFGGSLAEREERGFHADWERRVFGMNLLLMVRGCFSIDAMRHALERIEPVAYLSAGYYGRWLIGVEMLIAEAGGRPQPESLRDPTARRAIPARPRFAVGSAVRARNLHPPGHIRLPGYARGRLGTVVLQQGAWVLPDTNAHGRGECPEHVYAVRFEGRELWGEDAEPGSCVHLDLFESYLEPA
jgi:nitrile hydratase